MFGNTPEYTFYVIAAREAPDRAIGGMWKTETEAREWAAEAGIPVLRVDRALSRAQWELALASMGGH